MTRTPAKTAPLLWVTNIATPYRAPLWRELARHTPLTVALLAEQEHNRQWKVTLAPESYQVLQCRARPLYRTADSTIYAPSARLLRAIARRPRAVVLDGWESPAYLTALAWARMVRVPVYASYRGNAGTHRFSTGPVAGVRNVFMRSVAGVLTAGTASTSAVVGMGVPRQRVVEGFNTVDVQRFAVGAAAARAADRSHRSGHRFLYVGMLIERKNVEGLIRAFASIRRPDDSLTIVGTGPMQSRLVALAGALGLEDSVRFTGHLDGDELTEQYGRSDTFVLPSTSEVWGLVVNEALAAGLDAVVSTAAGVAPEVAGMPGVFLGDPTADGLAAAMVAARAGWRGPRSDHPVKTHTPAALAAVVAGLVCRGGVA